MAGLFRAYGLIRRGAAPWRSPFLIPIGDIVPPFIQGSSHVSIDTGGTVPDLRLALVPLSIDHFPTITVQFRVQPMPGRIVSDITLRMVVLMKGESPLLDSGPLEADTTFAALDYRVPPGRNFPPELTITLTSAVNRIEPSDLSHTPPNLTQPIAPTARIVDEVRITIAADPLEVGGGMVRGPMVHLNGVETRYNPFTNSGYGETAEQIRGIDLDWFEPTPPVAAPRPKSATWLGAVATGNSPAPSGLSVRIHTPTTTSAPPGKPTVAPIAGGTLRPGSYRYCTTWVSINGNETGASSRSDIVAVGGANSAVRLTDLPAAPARPVPDHNNIGVSKRRIYRTDGDPSVDPADADRGGRGEDVLVAELDPSVATFDDMGPSAAEMALPRQVRRDYLGIRYTSQNRMDITGSIRMVDDTTDETFGGSIASAPNVLRAVYRPGSEPKLALATDAPIPVLTVDMPGFTSPFGRGLFARAEGVPTKFALDWSILGAEFLGITVAGDHAMQAPTPDTAEPIGRVGLRFGPTAPPAGWPAGEADVAAELADDTSPAAGGLVALTGLRRGGIRSGGRLWSERDAQEGSVDITALFADAGPHHDRTLRFARRSGGPDPLPVLALEGHFLPEVVHARAQFPKVGASHLELDSRVRFLRAQVLAHLFAEPDPAHPEVLPPLTGVIDGLAFLDDTTDHLEATLGAAPKVTTAWPVRVAGTLHSRDADGAPPTMTVWPDVIVPDEVTVAPDWPMGADLAAPGLSGRVAVGFGDEAPLAVRANPQLKVLTNGDREPSPGLRALTARVLSVASAEIPKSITQFGDGGKGTGTVDVEPALEFHDRANTSLRAEVIERERRVAHEVDLRAPAGARSWLRARTAHLPQVLKPMVRLVEGSPLGAELVVSEPWGAGVLWAEPSYVWVPPPNAAAGAESDLSEDQGIGLATVGWGGIPARVEGWLISDTPALDGKVDTADRLPDVGPVASDWVPGGVVVRVDGPLRLSGLQLALRTGASRVCWNDNTEGGFGVGVILEPDHPVRHGNWIEAVAPFVELVPASPGIRDVIVWSAKSNESPPPPDPLPPEPNPCSASGDGPDGPTTALGWLVHDEMRLRTALKYYDLVTPSGPLDPAPRWWSMPRKKERWGDEDVDAGEWQLRYEVQMDDYGMAKVVVSPDLGVFGSPNVRDNPFGDWQGGNGKYWIRARTVDFWWVFHCDIYIGNVGGGTGIPFTNAIYSTLPRIFNWSYP